MILLGRLIFLAAVLFAFWSAGRCLIAGVTGSACTRSSSLPCLAIGAALFMAASGYLLLARHAGPFSTMALLLAFVLVSFLVPFRVERLHISGSKAEAGALALLALVALATILYVALPPSFNANDDGPGYYVFIRELVAQGSLGEQPFSERRLFTLGGHFPLAALADYFFSTEGQSIVDPGIGLALVGSILHWLVVSKRTSRLAAFLVLAAIGVQLAIDSPIKNSIPVMVPFAMVLAMALAATRPSREFDGGELAAACMGLAFATAILFRVTLLPYVVVLIAIFVWRSGSWRDVVKAASIAGLASLLVVLPFALLMRESSGTLLFPVLGTGVHASTFQASSFTRGSIFEQAVQALTVVGTDVRILAIGGLVSLRYWMSRDLRALRPWLLAIAGFVLASCALVASTGGLAYERYSFPAVSALLAAAVLSFPPLNWAWSPSVLQGRRRTILAGLALAVAGVAVAAAMTENRIHRVAASIRNRIDIRFASMAQSGDEARSYARAADVIPNGASVLTTLVRAYLLPQGRFRVLVHDQPGRAGPAPFWPADADGQVTSTTFDLTASTFSSRGAILRGPSRAMLAPVARNGKKRPRRHSAGSSWRSRQMHLRRASCIETIS